MKNTEIRIGNWHNPNFPMQIQAHDFMNMEVNNLSFNPIPLSEEWIIRLGFEKVEDLGDMIYYQIKGNKRGFGIKFDHDVWAFYLHARSEYTILIYDEPHFQYVHQLQNIYHSLTGQELQ